MLPSDINQILHSVREAKPKNMCWNQEKLRSFTSRQHFSCFPHQVKARAWVWDDTVIFSLNSKDGNHRWLGMCSQFLMANVNRKDLKTSWSAMVLCLRLSGYDWFSFLANIFDSLAPLLTCKQRPGLLQHENWGAAWWIILIRSAFADLQWEIISELFVHRIAV